MPAWRRDIMKKKLEEEKWVRHWPRAVSHLFPLLLLGQCFSVVVAHFPLPVVVSVFVEIHDTTYVLYKRYMCVVCHKCCLYVSYVLYMCYIMSCLCGTYVLHMCFSPFYPLPCFHKSVWAMLIFCQMASMCETVCMQQWNAKRTPSVRHDAEIIVQWMYSMIWEEIILITQALTQAWRDLSGTIG